MRFIKSRILSGALLARLLCLIHIGLSIYLLYANGQLNNLAYLVPTVGAILLLVETAVVWVVFDGDEPTSSRLIPTVLLIYVPTIIGCCWFLEIEDVQKQLVNELVSRTLREDDPTIIDANVAAKLTPTQLEIQIFLALVVFVCWAIPSKTSPNKSSSSWQLVKHFVVACDMLEFLSDITALGRRSNIQLVYWTLCAWTWSTLLFLVRVPKLDQSSSATQRRRKMFAYLTNSLLGVVFLDLPYFGIRIAAILAFGSHSTNSYFFATKNFALITFQFLRIRSIYLGRDYYENKEVGQQHLKDQQSGFDREPRSLFAQRFKVNEENNNNDDFSIQDSLEGLNINDNDAGLKIAYPVVQLIRMPRTIESVKNMSKTVNKPNSSIDDGLCNCDEDMQNKLSTRKKEDVITKCDLQQTRKPLSSHQYLPKKFTEV